MTVPALHIGGWYDLFLAHGLRSYEHLRDSHASGGPAGAQHLIIGPWSHTAGDITRPVPTVGGMTVGVSEMYPAGPADQSLVESREDVPCFTSAELTEPVEVIGNVTLTLFVSSSAPDTDFTGKPVDVYPGGRAILLCDGIQRMRYRRGLDDPVLMRRGEVCEITLDLVATASRFLPGHRIRLEVSSSNFPRYDRNSNTGGVIATEPADDFVNAVNTVLNGPVRSFPRPTSTSATLTSSAMKPSSVPRT